jgi:hypothetical protein
MHLRPSNKQQRRLDLSANISILARLQRLPYDFHRAQSTKPAAAMAKVAVGRTLRRVGRRFTPEGPPGQPTCRAGRNSC